MNIAHLAVSLFLIATALSPAQAAFTTPAGTWLGVLDTGSVKLRLGMEVVEDPTTGLSVNFTSLDQADAKIPSVRPEIVDRNLTAPLPTIGGAFHGTFSETGETITGTWRQGNLEMPLRLERVDRLPTLRRPQEPVPPFPYHSVEVTFTSVGGSHTLAGTLTLPRSPGPHPALVLVSGSGPQDRDETLMGHKPFAVLADALTRHGIAVLRYDDRGIGKSTGDFSNATTADLANDAHAAVRYLLARSDIDQQQIGVGGHSEGAMIAPMLAAQYRDEVSFIVLLAPPAITGGDTILTQGLAYERQMGMPEPEVLAQADLRRRAIRAAIESRTDKEFNASLRAAIEDRIAKLPNDESRDTVRDNYFRALSTYRTCWFRYFLAFDPTRHLERVSCPVLAVLGEKDIQVVPKDNLPPLRAALAAAPTNDVQIVTLPKLNHLLQTSKTGLPDEYGTIEETIAPIALDLITRWVAKHTSVAP